jgi:hypothetical protein
MAHTCSKCHRVNPPEAVYCYHDGMILDGHGRNGGPVPVGAKPFPNQFVFPSGRSCRNFDELAYACQQEWQGARSLLEQGYLERFLGGIGRADLALAAKEAARFPDRDRGLDQLLARLPSNVLQPPQLQVEPREVNLGQMQVGQDRRFDLHLDNAGKRLLYGTVSVEDCPWLSVGDGQGAAQKLFQFSDALTIPVHVRGKRFRAGNKPLEGRLLIESNGGSETIAVRVEVPVKPFPHGVFAGAKSPRQVAEKAKAAVDRSKTGNKAEAAEAAALFEKGAVAQWYKDNGWTYPVQAPSSSGLGAVQQFFEALGLTPPPKVDISERSVAMRGDPGDQLRHPLEITAQEKRPVWAHAVSDQPWLEVGRARLNGRTATIPLVVPNVPRRPGETLSARVTVTSNGNQRFVVPVTLTVGGAFVFAEPEPVATPAFVPPPAAPASELEVAPIIRRTSSAGMNPLHLLPLVLLFVVLGGIMLWDLLSKKDGTTPKEPPIAGGGGNFSWDDLLDREPRLGVSFQDERQRFGIVLLKQKDPLVGDKRKKLTYEEKGDTNNTCVKIDGHENLYWQKPGKLVKGNTEFSKFPDLKNRIGWKSTWEHFPGKIQVTQTVELVPGLETRVFDTVLVRYTVENKDTTPHTVGLRIMLDTFIGANDGVPFLVPGQPGLMTTSVELDSKDIPDYIEAWEREDPKNKGEVVRMGLKGITLPGGGEPEPIAKLVICRWPAEFAGEVRWGPPDWQYESIEKPNHRREKDSCVALYWAYRNMSPKEVREMAFTYGLGEIATGSGGNFNLALSAGGSFRKGGEFTLSAYVMNPQRGQKVELAPLPPHLALAKDEAYEKTVDVDEKTEMLKRAQVSWKIVSKDVGPFRLKVTSGQASQTYEGQIRTGGIFGR